MATIEFEPTVTVTAAAGIPNFKNFPLTLENVPVSALKDPARMEFLIRNAFLNHLRDFVVITHVALNEEEVPIGEL